MEIGVRSTFGYHRIIAIRHVASDEVHDFLFHLRSVVFCAVDVVVVDANGINNHFGVLLVDAVGTCSSPGVVLAIDKEQRAIGGGDEAGADVRQQGTVIGRVKPTVFCLQFARVLQDFVDVESGAFKLAGIGGVITPVLSKFLGTLNVVGVHITLVLILEDFFKDGGEELVVGHVEGRQLPCSRRLVGEELVEVSQTAVYVPSKREIGAVEVVCLKQLKEAGIKTLLPVLKQSTHECDHLAAFFRSAAFFLHVAAYGQIRKRIHERSAEGRGDGDVIGIEITQEERCHAVLAGARADPLARQQRFQCLNDGMVVGSGLADGQVGPTGIVGGLRVAEITVLHHHQVGIHVVGYVYKWKLSEIVKEGVSAGVEHRGSVAAHIEEKRFLTEGAGGGVVVVNGLVESHLVKFRVTSGIRVWNDGVNAVDDVERAQLATKGRASDGVRRNGIFLAANGEKGGCCQQQCCDDVFCSHDLYFVKSDISVFGTQKYKKSRQ